MWLLKQVIRLPEEGSKEKLPMSDQCLWQIIGKKLAGHKRQDMNSGCPGFNLKTNYILQLKEQQKNKCAGCAVEMVWDYAPKET